MLSQHTLVCFRVVLTFTRLVRVSHAGMAALGQARVAMSEPDSRRESLASLDAALPDLRADALSHLLESLGE